MQAASRVEQAFLEGSAERSPVRVGGAEVGVPGVQMRVEVDDRDRAVRGRERPQQGQRDGVIAAEGQQPRRPLEQVTGAALDGGDRLGDAERADGEITGIGGLDRGERRDGQRRVDRAPGR